MKTLKDLIRPNIYALSPYSSARDEYKGAEASCFLDANENPFNNPYNRYPDPQQIEVKKLLSKKKGVKMESIFLGNGSDEAIDLIFRIFCTPSVDNVVSIIPSYGMYDVAANINDIEVRDVLLNEEFQLSADLLLTSCDEHTKAIFLCTPNNPTGNDLERNEIIKLLNNFDGVVIIDEAYADFSEQRSFRYDLDKYPNAIVLNTFSKAWGSAGIRLGMAFASEEIISFFNKVKYPYNVNILTQLKALEFLRNYKKVEQWIATIKEQRSLIVKKFAELPICQKIYPTNANFFLTKVTDANSIYNYLVKNKVIVRNRTKVKLCHNCLRITVGKAEENEKLLEVLKQYKD